MIPAIGATTGIPADAADPKAIAAKVQAMFMEIMIKAMEGSVGAEEGLFGSSSSSEIYRGMFREQLGATMGEKIGGSLREELEKGMRKSAPAVPSLLHSLPVSGTVTSEVGWRNDPFTGARKLHKGTDIAAAEGTSILAVAGGVVVESGTKGGYGNTVVIKTDDGRRMLYGHNSANFVRVGDRVEQGAPIAAVGATGRATGPHVHFEVLEVKE
jgi:murein DD-endopeptidase MepM/ murein hydrolase activator NlpD